MRNGEQMQVLWAECNQDLQFVMEVFQQMRSAIASRVFFTDDWLKEGEKSVQCLQQKLSDRYLHVAVIGEFSSGKSTFINALLRDDLLKTSALVATAVATRLCYGEGLTVAAHINGERPGIIKTYPQSKKITIPWLPEINGIDNRQFIHLITSSDTLAKDIVDVKITLPSPFLSNNIVIIDTPGTNAIDLRHEEITRQVIEKEADMVIVIIPATVPLSQTFAQFLTATIHSHLHRCLFVVTKIDQIPQSEISIVLQTLRSRLVNILQIQPPLLYTCAPQVVIDSITEEVMIPEAQMVWKTRFFQLEKMILERLQQNRYLTKYETVLRLLIELFTQLDEQSYLPDFNQFTRQKIQQRRKYLLAQQEKLRRICFDNYTQNGLII